MIYVVFGTWLLLELIRNVSISIGIVLIGYFIINKLQTYYEEWKTKKYDKRLEREYEEFIQRLRERELREKEMNRHPLFYWRELTKWKP